MKKEEPEKVMVCAEKYKTMNGEVKKVMSPVFNEEEAGRAEAIVNALEGLTIESAQQLLEQVNRYLLQTVFCTRLWQEPVSTV